jgi:SAM-dependent methyltransferase
LSEQTNYELDLLTHAHRYQQWVADTVRPFLGERILEVGAGIGNMSQWLPARGRLVLSESDDRFLPRLSQIVEAKFGPGNEKVAVRKLDLARDWSTELAQERFDTVVSFNVMEHIEDDLKALRDFRRALTAGTGPKRIVTFVPAHAWAYGSLDRKFGHHRRYSAARFRELAREIGARAEGRYFNAVGVPGWFMMGRVLKRQEIGAGAVAAFERICPWVRGADDWVHERLRLPVGQSYLSVLTLE